MTGRLSAFVENTDHEFWPDDFSFRNPGLFDHGLILSPKHITDLYLLETAARNGGRLATFDRHIPLRAVRSATRECLEVL